MEICGALFGKRDTKITCEDNPKYGAPHHFKVLDKNDNVIGKVDFQEGPIRENGNNGVSNEDLLVMVIKRLKGFQASSFSCRENALAITKIEEGLMWLERRTAERANRGVKGTSNK